MAVVGVDDDHLLGNLSNPPLSSVALNLKKAGYQAAQLLQQLAARQRRERADRLRLSLFGLWLGNPRMSLRPPIRTWLRPAIHPRTCEGADRSERRS